MWRNTRIKFICRLGYGDPIPVDDDSPGDIPVFGSNGPYATTLKPNTRIPAIVLGRKGSYGKVNWAPDGCHASDTTFFIDDHLTHANLRWLYWTLQSLGLDEGSQEAAIPGLSRETVYERKVFLPTLEDQSKIASFLDQEIAHIDVLITEKEHMLALVEEKRAALISRVVTRGLDPDAPLKDSGQEWLGMIPAHWKVIRIKHVTASLDQGSSPVAANTPATPGELGILKLSAVSKGLFKREENKALREKEEEEQLLALVKGDILITRGNTPDLVADAAVVPEDEPSLLLPDLIYRLRVEDRAIAPEYLASFLITPAARVQIRRDARGSSGSMVKVSQSHILDWVTPLPPLAEQLEIINYLREKESHQELLSGEVSSSLELLIERRAALITAAVTVQIPVEEMRQ